MREEQEIAGAVQGASSGLFPLLVADQAWKSFQPLISLPLFRNNIWISSLAEIPSQTLKHKRRSRRLRIVRRTQHYVLNIPLPSGLHPS